jgi:hypothetical protein
MTQPTQLQVKELFDYHPNGYLVWAINRRRGRIGNKVGIVHTNGYFRTRVNGKLESNHRITFLWHHGYLPKFVDHIDGNKLNNKIENLRPANDVQNQQNSKLSVKSTSGFKNVNFCPQTKKWAVKISVCGKKKTIGRYDDIELADLIAQEARSKYHGEYARNN